MRETLTKQRFFGGPHVLVMVLLTAPVLAWSQSSAEPATSASTKDVLLFNDGEKLIGKLQRSTGTSVVFQSDMAGEVTVAWSKIKELQSGQTFAVVPKGVNVEEEKDYRKVVQGTVLVEGGKLQVKTATRQR